MSNWINVKDRLPDIPKNDFASDYVLIHDKKAGDWVAYYDANGVGVKQESASHSKMLHIGCLCLNRLRRIKDGWIRSVNGSDEPMCCIS